MKVRFAALALMLLAIGGAVAGAQVVAPASPSAPAATQDRFASVKRLIETEAEKQRLVGLSVCVARDGQILLEHHVGFQDREAKIAAGPQTMYRWASISKPVTAAAAMLLAESGKFNLDADVRELVPEFPKKPWPITSRQLLCHQGGVVHYSNGKVVALPVPKEPAHPYEDLVLALGTFKESDLVCEPGTKYAYTTHGYMLLGAAVERAAGEKFWPFVRERIAKPAGMTTFQPDYQWLKIDNRAVGYRKRADEMVPSTDTDVSWKLAGGGFISTVGDLSRFSVALMDGKLVKPETFAAMRTKQKLRNGEATGYGLGLGVGILNGRPTASHSGSQEKSATMLLMMPEERLSVAVMCNTEGARLGGLAAAVATELLGPAPLPAGPAKP